MTHYAIQTRHVSVSAVEPIDVVEISCKNARTASIRTGATEVLSRFERLSGAGGFLFGSCTNSGSSDTSAPPSVIFTKGSRDVYIAPHATCLRGLARKFAHVSV
jgi:hypothetical protein